MSSKGDNHPHTQAQPSSARSANAATRQLTDGLLRGEAAAQQQLLQLYAPGVFQLIARIVPVAQDVEELTQDTLLRALQNIQRYDSAQASLTTWLHRIAYRLALNHLRSRSSSVSVASDFTAAATSPADISLEALQDPDSPQPFTNDCLVPLLLEALDHLPPDEQTLVHLYYYDDLPLNEIAYIIEAPPGTIATRLHRIRRTLHHIIQKLQQQ